MRSSWSWYTSSGGKKDRKHKDRFGCTPRKGTKLRRFLMATLRPEGCTTEEAAEIFGRVHDAHAAVIKLLDEKGWDVRCFRGRRFVSAGHSPNDHSLSVFRCVGRLKWDGSYRSFVKGE